MNDRLSRFAAFAIVAVALFLITYIGTMILRSSTEVGRCILFSGVLFLLATIEAREPKLPTKAEARKDASLLMDCIEMHEKLNREEVEGRMWQWITKNFSSRS